MSCRAYYLSPEGQLHQDLGKEEIRNAYQSGQSLLWIDICETAQEDGEFLVQELGLHHLAAEDCVSLNIHPPKIDDFGDYVFIIVHGINHAEETEIVETAELAIFLGSHFVVSNHNVPLFSVESIRQLVAEDGRPMRRGADFLVYAMIDALIDNVLPTIDQMSDVAEEIEEETIRNPHQTTLEAILKLKRSTLRIHRVMAPQREVMKTLAVVAAIFMPLTLLAGIYGMNFENMPELKWSWGYFAVLGIMGMVIITALWRFWASNWFSWGRRRVSRIGLFVVEPEKLIGSMGRLTGWPRRRNQ